MKRIAEQVMPALRDHVSAVYRLGRRQASAPRTRTRLPFSSVPRGVYRTNAW